MLISDWLMQERQEREEEEGEELVEVTSEEGEKI